MRDKKTLLLSLAWLLLILLSFLWNYSSSKKEQARIALITSRGVFEHILTTRLWNARHGGLYAPVTPSMQPNRHLDVPMRDVKVNDSLTLTQINPSFMTRQIAEIAIEKSGIQYHMTSLNPIRPKNNPTSSEKIILHDFENGVVEKGYFPKDGNKEYYFYMASLKAENECLKCHDKQGYKKDDIMGGVSIKLPMVAQLPIYSLIFGHAAIAALGLVGIFIAVGRLNKAYDKIKNQAVTDALTGIPNRRHFSATILKEFNRSRRDLQPLSIIMCDIDNFKIYNDTYGHSKGDSCLKNIAQAIEGSLGRASDFCARYGGEEFIVILPNTPSHGAMKIAEKLRSDIEKIKIKHENSLPAQIVTLSLGVATIEAADIIPLEELIKKADMALYEAKEQGKNKVCFLEKKTAQ